MTEVSRSRDLHATGSQQDLKRAYASSIARYVRGKRQTARSAVHAGASVNPANSWRSPSWAPVERLECTRDFTEDTAASSSHAGKPGL
jgi:hypothetical protein